MQQYHLTSLYSMLSWIRSPLLPLRASLDRGVVSALRISGIELMKAVRVWRVEEGPVRRVLLGRAIGCTASEKEH